MFNQEKMHCPKDYFEKILSFFALAPAQWSCGDVTST
jgi:hypothetical protein